MADFNLGTSLTQNWDAKGRVFYTDENGNKVDLNTPFLERVGNRLKAMAFNAGRWLTNENTESQDYKDKVSFTAGLVTMPLGMGKAATGALATKLTPRFGKKIAQQTAEGIGGGLAGGTVMGGIDAAQNGENVPLGMLTGGAIGAVTGGALGAGGGYIGKSFAKRGLLDNEQAKTNYIYDYLTGLSPNNQKKELDEFRRLWQSGYVGRGTGEVLFDEVENIPLTKTDAFKNWSGDTPMVSSKEALDYPFKTGQGVTVKGYHGTKRGDRVGAEFKKERATSGPMAFFSSDKDIATNYSKGKEDTSLAEEMMDYWQWFKYRDKDGNLKPLGDAWWDLSSDERWAVAKNAPHISFDDEANNIIFDQANNIGVGNYDYALKQYRNNPLKALIDGWLEGGSLYGREDDFLKVLEKAGVNMDNIDYIDPYTDHSKVYDVYLSMKKPLVTNDIPNDLVERLSAEAPNNPAKYQDGYGVDLWDKNRRDGVEWVNELKNDIAAGENSHAWTSIPDWVTEEMKKQGYDGIIDMGGKGGGEIHKVYIPFEPTQIKSVNNQGTFDPTNPNIYKSILPIGGVSLFNLLQNKEDKI